MGIPPIDREESIAAADTLVEEAAAYLAQIEAFTGIRSESYDLLLAVARAERTRFDDPPPAEPWADIAVRADHDVYLGAYARWRQAEALLAGRSPTARSDAADVVRAAHDTAARLGAEPLLRELRELADRARVYLTPAEPVIEEATEPNALARYGFTDREIEVLRLLSQGLSNGEIGQALFISRKTASAHVSHILRKLTVTSRGQAAAMAHRLELQRAG